MDWILAAPETDVIESEPPLAAQYAADRRTKALGELRLLYVAMTRARRALYLVTTAPAEKSATLRLDNVLQNTLAPGATPDPEQPVWETGNADWWRQPAPAGKSAASPASPAPLKAASLPAAPAPPPAGCAHRLAGSRRRQCQSRLDLPPRRRRRPRSRHPRPRTL